MIEELRNIISIDVVLRNLEIALSQVSRDFIEIEVSFQEATIARERVFCYELYHQFRNIVGDTFPLVFHGELDKSGHRDIVNRLQKIPDFILHQPGSFRDNFAIIEVKRELSSNGIAKDFETLIGFIEEVSYQWGIFIGFSFSMNELIEFIKEKSEIVQYIIEKEDFLSRIFLICMPEPDGPIEIKKMSDALTE